MGNNIKSEEDGKIFDLFQISEKKEKKQCRHALIKSHHLLALYPIVLHK